MHPVRLRHRRTVGLLACVSLLAPVGVLTASPAAAAPADIVINEIESNGDTTDWIELTNTGVEPVDVSGWILKDDDDSRTLAVAAGTTIEPGGFLAVDVDVDGVPGEFGLGGTDTARVFLPDGTTLIDEHAYAGHALTTYGRCPDGTGDFITTTSSTKGTANDCTPRVPDVVVNEVESNGDTTDWIELRNNSAFPADVSGWILKDDDDSRTLAIAGGTTIPVGGYLAVDVNVDTTPGTFGLGGTDTARVFLPDGTTLIDEYAYVGHAATTYGRCPDGTGDFVVTTSSTKSAANDCPAGSVPSIVVNEVESNGDATDWIELLNTGAAPVDVSGWIVKDNDDGRTLAIAGGTIVPAGGYLAVDTDLDSLPNGFGLGNNDSARIFLPDGTTLIAEYSWTGHAATSYGRCPDGTGEFVTTTSTTRAAANDCGPAVRINEVESNGDATDWIELVNNGVTPVDVSGWILKDDDDSRTLAIAGGTTIAAGGHLAVDVDVDGVPGEFGLGGADSARVFLPDGTTLVDEYAWLTHAATTYGRCPDGTGEFATTQVSTKGAVNQCVGDLVTVPFPGSPDVTAVDVPGTFPTNLSGLAYEAAASVADDSLWAVVNGPGTLHRLTSTGGVWDPVDTWTLRYPDGTGDVDAEGVALTAAGSAGGVYVASERNNDGGGSRLSVLRYDVSGGGPDLAATREWNLTADLPVVAANAGFEGIAWIPDADLVAGGFVDESTGVAYDPADYPGHGSGVFFLGVEAGGTVYAYVLGDGGAFARVATIDSGFGSVMELEYEPASRGLWAVCDDTCDGRSTILTLTDGAFGADEVQERPAGLPNVNHEGFAIAPESRCVDGLKPAFWSDDNGTDGRALREGAVRCLGDAGVTPPVVDTGDTGVGGGAPGGLATVIGSLPVVGSQVPLTVLFGLLLLPVGVAIAVAAHRRREGAQ